MNKKPKIVVIGAGSASFGLTNLGAIMRTPELHGATLSLCDLNKEGLDLITTLANRINREWDAQMTIESSTDRTQVLSNSDYVILSVAIDREKCWIQDCELGEKYGIKHYGENGGPGGFFHAARNTALILPILKDIEKLAPNSYLLNFTNPMTRICTVAARYTNVKTVGICHQLDFGYIMAARILGEELGLDVKHDYIFTWGDQKGISRTLREAAYDRFDILAGGINHFTWMLSIKDKQTGDELLPLFKQLFVNQKEFEPYTRKLIETFGECPTSGDAHCLEYIPYTSNMERKTWEKFDIQMYPLIGQEKKRDRIWRKIANMASGKESIDYMRDVHTDRAELIITALWEGQNLYDMAVNIPNTTGYISNIDSDAIVEVPAVIGHHGIKGVAIGDLPAIPAQFCNRQKTIVDLAIKSIVEGDYQLGLQALAIDPMIDDLDIAKAILDDGLELFRPYLSTF